MNILQTPAQYAQTLLVFAYGDAKVAIRCLFDIAAAPPAPIPASYLADVAIILSAKVKG